MLEDLASQFGLRVQEAIQRLEDLQEMGRLTGITSKNTFFHLLFYRFHFVFIALLKITIMFLKTKERNYAYWEKMLGFTDKTVNTANMTHQQDM